MNTIMIAANQSVSTTLHLVSEALVALLMPPAWTAATLTLQVGVGGEWLDVYRADGSEYTIAAAASRAVLLNPDELRGATVVRLRSGTAAIPVLQTADRPIIAITRPI